MKIIKHTGYFTASDYYFDIPKFYYECYYCGNHLDSWYNYIIHELEENNVLPSDYKKICCKCFDVINRLKNFDVRDITFKSFTIVLHYRGTEKTTSVDIRRMQGYLKQYNFYEIFDIFFDKACKFAYSEILKYYNHGRET